MASRDAETVSHLYEDLDAFMDPAILSTSRVGSRTSSERAQPPELAPKRLSKATAPHRHPLRPVYATNM